MYRKIYLNRVLIVPYFSFEWAGNYESIKRPHLKYNSDEITMNMNESHNDIFHTWCSDQGANGETVELSEENWRKWRRRNGMTDEERK